MTSHKKVIDPKKLERYGSKVLDCWGGLVLSCVIYLGDKLGLYKILASDGPLTPEALAEKAGVNERWTREWLYSQAAAEFIEYNNGLFSLSPEGEMILADENSLMFLAGAFEQAVAFGKVLPQLPECFKTGIGLPFDAFGEYGVRSTERFVAPWYRSELINTVLPALRDITPKLAKGAKVADIGCGSGIALIEIAKAFPQSEYHGYELSEYAIERANQNKQQAGVNNVHFHHVKQKSLPKDRSYDLIMSFDCIHDLSYPEQVIQEIYHSLKSDGVFFVADMNAKPNFQQTVMENPLAAYQYANSVICCLSASLSQPHGCGLGTLGLSPDVMQKYATQAGFTQMKLHDFNNPLNIYYEIRP